MCVVWCAEDGGVGPVRTFDEGSDGWVQGCGVRLGHLNGGETWVYNCNELSGRMRGDMAMAFADEAAAANHGDFERRLLLHFAGVNTSYSMIYNRLLYCWTERPSQVSRLYKIGKSFSLPPQTQRS